MHEDLAARRRFFAEEIEAVANLKTPGLAAALAAVPRERFLPPGPWVVRSEADFGAPPRQTPDADPRHVYHNLSVAIDPARMLFNGGPALVTLLLDTVNLRPGARVLHVGCGTGYYTALIASVVGREGMVEAVDIDEALAAGAADNLREWPWTKVRQGDGTRLSGNAFDAIVINAGVTHPLRAWLEALAPGGRLVLPLTVTMEAMGPIGKGLVVLLTNEAGQVSARAVTIVAIYSAVGIRDAAVNSLLGDALKRSPFPRLSRLRSDAHEPQATCWLHTESFCLG